MEDSVSGRMKEREGNQSNYTRRKLERKIHEG